MIANNTNSAVQLEAEMKQEFNIRSMTLKDKTEVFKEALGYVPSPGGMTPQEMNQVVTHLKADREQ